jgi:hypothetical protein
MSNEWRVQKKTQINEEALIKIREAQAVQMRQPKAPTPGYFPQAPKLPRQQILGRIAVS